MAFKLAQETLEGELYITGSRVVAILEKIRADLILTRLRVGGFGEGNLRVDFGDRGFRDKVWRWFKRVRGGLRRPFSPTSWLH